MNQTAGLMQAPKSDFGEIDELQRITAAKIAKVFKVPAELLKDREGKWLIFSRPESEAAVQMLPALLPICPQAALPIEPGHVMSREKYEQMVEERQK